MLDKLFSPALRLKILKYFLLNPEKKIYLGELARDLDMDDKLVRREVESLKKMEVLISGNEFLGENKEAGAEDENLNKKARKKYFTANKDFFLFNEARELLIKAQILHEKDFAEKLRKIGDLQLLIFTGIFVNNFDSPVDLLIVGRLNRAHLPQLIRELEKEVGREINFTLMSRTELKYRRDITDVFLYNILEGKKFVAIDKIGVS